MRTYDEITKNEVTNPDLEAGYIYDGVIVLQYLPSELVGHYFEEVQTL